MPGLKPISRADMRAGTVYAISGNDGWIYYGQIGVDKAVGFFRRRDRNIADATDVIQSPLMTVVSIAYPSIGRAIRNGKWTKLGSYELADALKSNMVTVNCPVATTRVTVFVGTVEYDTDISDPAIQSLEVAAVWDAEHHMPDRLQAEFEQDSDGWKYGGSVLSLRHQKQDLAKRFPDEPHHALPDHWVYI